MVRRPVGIVTAFTITTLLVVGCSGQASHTDQLQPTGDPAAITVAPTDGVASSTEAPPRETLAPTATTTSGPTFLQVPSVVCCRGQTVDAGRYELPRWLGIPLSVGVPGGWRVLNEGRALLFLLGRGENVQDNPSQLLVFLDASGEDTPGAIIRSIQQAEQLTTIGEPTDVTIAGFPSVQLDSSAMPNPTFEGVPQADVPPGVQYLPVIERYLAPGFVWTTSSPEARVRSIALTVGEQTLLVYLEAPPAEFDQFAADAGTILESLELIGP